MIAARLFNERDGTPMPAIYGVVTTGTLWRFLEIGRIVQRVQLDQHEYHIERVGKILGILLAISRANVELGGIGIPPERQRRTNHCRRFRLAQFLVRRRSAAPLRFPAATATPSARRSVAFPGRYTILAGTLRAAI